MISEEKIKKSLTKSAGTLIITGILILVLGIIAIVYPASAGKVATATLGIIMVIGALLD